MAPSAPAAVPGPPRGRRRALSARAGGPVGIAEAFEQASFDPVAVLALLRDVVLLLKDLAVDPRVPWREKALAGAAVLYLVVPIDLVPDSVPVLGQLDDWWVVVTAIRRLLRVAGYDLIYEHWRGTDEGLHVVLALTGVEK